MTIASHTARDPERHCNEPTWKFFPSQSWDVPSILPNVAWKMILSFLNSLQPFFEMALTFLVNSFLRCSLALSFQPTLLVLKHYYWYPTKMIYPFPSPPPPKNTVVFVSNDIQPTSGLLPTTWWLVVPGVYRG